MTTTKLSIRGMHCSSCKMLIEDACQDLRGVKSCRVDVQSETAVIEHDGSVDINAFKTEIGGLGEYKVDEIYD